jgi:uncharacterized protein (DUF1697 family)
MALVVFLRGVNVGGHRRFRPSVLARELSRHAVVNVGAAGTFVVRRPGSEAAFRTALRRTLPFDTHVLVCEGRELTRAVARHPFGAARRDVVRFMSIFPGAAGRLPLPISLPAQGKWLVRVIAARGRFVFGEYRRHMKTIGYLGQLDRLFGGAATTRNWNTIGTVLRLLQDGEAGKPGD